MIYLELFLTFFKLGALTFGGGAAMMPFVQNEALNHGWLTKSEFIDFVAISESTPGPFAVNIATYVGSDQAGFLGAVCATLGLVLPSFIIILIIAKCYEKFKTSTLVAGAMNGLRPASVGLIGAATVSIGMEVLFPGGFALESMLGYHFITSFILFAALLCLCIFIKKLNPIYVIIISAVLGIGLGYLEKLFV